MTFCGSIDIHRCSNPLVRRPSGKIEHALCGRKGLTNSVVSDYLCANLSELMPKHRRMHYAFAYVYCIVQYVDMCVWVSVYLSIPDSVAHVLRDWGITRTITHKQVHDLRNQIESFYLSVTVSGREVDPNLLRTTSWSPELRMDTVVFQHRMGPYQHLGAPVGTVVGSTA